MTLFDKHRSQTITLDALCSTYSVVRPNGACMQGAKSAGVQVQLTASYGQHVLECASQLHPCDVCGAVAPEAGCRQQRLNTSSNCFILQHMNKKHIVMVPFLSFIYSMP